MGNANKIKQKEAETIDRKLLKNIGKIGLVLTTATGIAGGVSELSKAANKDVGPSGEFERNAEIIEVDSVSFHGGPNVRINPEVPSGEEASNVIIDLGNSDQDIVLSEYNDSIYVYDPRDDANGEWVGFSAEKFADALYESSYIDEKTKDKIIESEQGEQRDGIVWVNGNYVEWQPA